MSENTWPNPDRPGIPLNPDRDGWHWVKSIYGISHPRPRLWWSKIDRWELSDGALINPSEFAERWRYLGPCLTPAEIAAQAARITELNSALENVLWVYRATQSGGGNAETTNKIEEKIANAYAILQKGKKDE